VIFVSVDALSALGSIMRSGHSARPTENQETYAARCLDPIDYHEYFQYGANNHEQVKIARVVAVSSVDKFALPTVSVTRLTVAMQWLATSAHEQHCYVDSAKSASEERMWGFLI